MMKSKKQRIKIASKKYTTKEELVTVIKKADSQIEEIKDFDFDSVSKQSSFVLEVKKSSSEHFQSISIEKPSLKKQLILMLVVMVVFIGGYYLWFANSHKEELIQPAIIPSDLAPDIKDAKGIDKKELVKKMQSVVDDGYFNLQMDTELIFNSSNENGKIQIINPEQNKSIIAVDVFLDGEDDLLYESGSIYPRQYVNKGKLLKELPKGEYQAYAKAKIYDLETKKEQTTSIVNLTIQVKN